MTVAATEPGVQPGAPPSAPDRFALPGLILLVLAALGLFVAYRTQANYDATYSLVWGRDLLHGELPGFDAYRASTPHPLALVLGAVLSPLGDLAPRAWVLMTMVAFVALVCGVHRFARLIFGPLVALLAAALVATRPDFVSLGLNGSQDMPFLALFVWVFALEAARPRRGGAVWVLIVLAGLLRPEAWLLGGLYWLWLLPGSNWPERVRRSGLVAVAPAVWLAMDLLVTGDPLHSFTHTTDLAGSLGKQESAVGAAAEAAPALARFVKPVELLLACAGVLVAWRYAPRRAYLPFLLVGFGIATYLLLALAGFSAIPRYLASAAVGVLVLAAVACGGFTLLEVGERGRRLWIAATCAALLASAGYLAVRGSFGQVLDQAALRVDVRADLAALVDGERFAAALECGDVTVPNHNMTPYLRWRLDLGEGDVRARSAGSGPAGNGAHLIVRGEALESEFRPFQADDPPEVQQVQPGWEPLARNRSFEAYRAC